MNKLFSSTKNLILSKQRTIFSSAMIVAVMIIISGALTSSFIPIFIKYKQDKKDLNENISSIINVISLFLFSFVVLIVIFADKIFPVITTGFSKEKVDQVVFFSRILLIGQLPFLVFGNFLTGIGQANKTFFISAIAPVVY